MALVIGSAMLSRDSLRTLGIEFSIWIKDCLNSDLPENVFFACSGIENL